MARSAVLIPGFYYDPVIFGFGAEAAAGDPPVFSGTIATQNAQVGAAFAGLDLNDYFAPDPDSWVRLGDDPATVGLTFSAGTITGTPTSSATLSLQYRGVNADGTDDTNVFSFVVAVAADTVPFQFRFSDKDNQPLSTVVESGAITPDGYDAPTAVTVTGGSVSINGGAYTASPGNISPGQTIQARGTSSGAFNTDVNVFVTIGGVSDTFRVTTYAAPALVSARVVANGDQVEYTWNRAMTAGTGGATGFALSASGGAVTPAYSSGDGTTKWLYDASRTLEASETITTAYTQPGDGVEDADGNDVSSFSGVLVAFSNLRHLGAALLQNDPDYLHNSVTKRHNDPSLAHNGG